MSFRCAQCGEPKRHGRMVVRETRVKEYFEFRTVRGALVPVPVGSGYETVREERVCTDCLTPKLIEKMPGGPHDAEKLAKLHNELTKVA